MKKVLIFSLAYYPRKVGGAEVAVKEITDRLGRGDFSFDMICLNAGGEARIEKLGQVKIYRVLGRFNIFTKLLFPFAAIAKAVRLHREYEYDIVWSIMASYAGFAGMMFRSKFPHIPHLLTIQEGDHFEIRSRLLKPFFKKIFRSASHIQCISHFLAEWSTHMGATCPLDVVPNGVDIELFSKLVDKARTNEIWQEIGRQNGETWLVTASRLVEKNAVGNVIDALAGLPKEVKFLVIGSGDQEDYLRNRVELLGLTERVVFKGYVSHADLPTYLQACDIFIRPSLTEGLGNSFLEAMAAHIPVIATNVGGISDFLRDGQTGFVCEVNNPKSIVEKVELIRSDKELRDRVVSAALTMVRNGYDWNMIAQNMKKIFSMLAGQ